MQRAALARALARARSFEELTACPSSAGGWQITRAWPS